MIVAYNDGTRYLPMAKQHIDLIGRLMKWMNPFAIQNYRRRIGPSKVLLILTTRGRKTGKPHLTPLQFEEIDGSFYIASARGKASDWYRNILVDPEVKVDVNQKHFRCRAETITDTMRIADFLEYRLERHPVMIRMMLWMEGLPLCIKREDIEALAEKKALVAIHLKEPLN